MPSSGAPASTRARIADTHSGVSARVAPKCPTPGTTIASAAARSAAAAGTSTCAPRAANAFLTDVRLPAP